MLENQKGLLELFLGCIMQPGLTLNSVLNCSEQLALPKVRCLVATSMLLSFILPLSMRLPTPSTRKDSLVKLKTWFTKQLADSLVQLYRTYSLDSRQGSWEVMHTSLTMKVQVKTKAVSEMHSNSTNTTITHKFLTACMNSVQAHLKPITKFLKPGIGSWWRKTEVEY